MLKKSELFSFYDQESKPKFFYIITNKITYENIIFANLSIFSIEEYYNFIK